MAGNLKCFFFTILIIKNEKEYSVNIFDVKL